MTELREVVVTPAVEIQVSFGGDGTRGFAVRFAPLPMDQARSDLDEVLDRVLDAVERQRARFELADKEAKLEELVVAIRRAEGSQILVEEQYKLRWEAEGRKGEWTADKLPASEAMKRQNTEVGLQRDRATADYLDAEIRKLRAKVNGHAADVSSNSHTSHANR